MADRLSDERIDAVVEKIARLVHDEDERLIQQGRDEVVESAEPFLFELESNPKVVLTTVWLMRETLIRMMREGGQSREYTVSDKHANVFACAMFHPTPTEVDRVIARLRDFIGKD